MDNSTKMNWLAPVAAVIATCVSLYTHFKTSAYDQVKMEKVVEINKEKIDEINTTVKDMDKKVIILWHELKKQNPNLNLDSFKALISKKDTSINSTLLGFDAIKNLSKEEGIEYLVKSLDFGRVEAQSIYKKP